MQPYLVLSQDTNKNREKTACFNRWCLYILLYLNYKLTNTVLKFFIEVLVISNIFY